MAYPTSPSETVNAETPVTDVDDNDFIDGSDRSTFNGGIGTPLSADEYILSTDSDVENTSGFGGNDYIDLGNGSDQTDATLDTVDGGTGDDYIEVDMGAAATTTTGVIVLGGIGAGEDYIKVSGIYGDEWTTEASFAPDIGFNPASEGNEGYINAGAGSDTIELDGTSGKTAAEVYGDVVSDVSGAEVDTYIINTAGGDDVIYLDDFSDNGTDDEYDAGVDDLVIINGEAMTDWTFLDAGDASANAQIASVKQVTKPGSGDGAIQITTLDGSVIFIDNMEMACFVTGTSITTPEGEVAVETLTIGDMVTTADGKTAPVKWIGRREVSSVFATNNASVQPILITQGALGNGLPTADLRVSPDHAMLVDGVLVHAEALVNGTSIVQEAIAETFTYFHIELENHDLVLANGAPAETFVDSDVRARFDNAAEYVALYGTTESAAPMALPRVKSKRQLPAALKAKLA